MFVIKRQNITSELGLILNNKTFPILNSLKKKKINYHGVKEIVWHLKNRRYANRLCVMLIIILIRRDL